MKNIKFKKDVINKYFERFNRVFPLLFRFFCFSFIGMILGISIVNYFPMLVPYEEFIYAVLLSLGTTIAIYSFGFHLFKWLIFLIFYIYFLIPYAIAIGIANNTPAGAVALKIVFGIIIMILLIIGVRLYITKDIAIQIGRFQFGDVPSLESTLEPNEEE